MKRLILLLVVVLLWGCSPQRRLANLLERFPLEETISIEYRDTLIYRDTTITRYLPGDTVYRDTLIPFEVDIPDMELTTASTLAQASAGLRDNHLWLELIQYDSILKFKLDSAIQESSDTTINIIRIPYPVIEKVGQFWKHGFLILAGMILVLAVLWFLLKK